MRLVVSELMQMNETWDDSAPSKTLMNSEKQLFIAEWSSTYVLSTLYELHLRKTQKKKK